MNGLEYRAIELALKEMQKTVGDIEDLRFRINHLIDKECNLKLSVEGIEKECNRIIDEELRSINEWLHALKNNQTR